MKRTRGKARRQHRGEFSGRRWSQHARRVGEERAEVEESRPCSAPREIPGFYYDAEKNRYFRLLPGNNRHNPLTRDGVSKAQHKRQEARFEARKESNGRHPPVSMAKLLYDRQLGQASAQACSYRVARKQLKTSCTATRLASFPDVRTMRMALDYRGSLLFACQQNYILETLTHLYSFDHTPASPSLNHTSMKKCSFDPFKALSWSPRSSDGLVLAQEVSRCAFMSPEFQPAMLIHCQTDLCAESGPQISSFTRLRFSTRDIHDCVWDPSGARDAVLVAEEKTTALVDIQHKRTISYYHHSSHGLCISMSKTRPLAVCGLRNGCVSLLDLRMKKAGAVLLRGPHHQPLAICKVQLLCSDQMAMVASLDNRLALWDIRASGKPDCTVCTFREHQNADGLSLDAAVYDDNWLAAAGQDNRVRVWSTRSGELLCTICPPAHCCTSDKGYRLNFVWAPSWPGHSSTPGLLIRWPYDDDCYWHGGMLT